MKIQLNNDIIELNTLKEYENYIKQFDHYDFQKLTKDKYESIIQNIDLVHLYKYGNTKVRPKEGRNIAVKALMNIIKTTNSCFNTAFYTDVGYTLLEAKKKVSEIQKKNSKTAHKKTILVPTMKEYWLNKGFSEIESIYKVSERQRTFSLKKLEQRYGKEEAKKLMNSRNSKWRETLKNNGIYTGMSVCPSGVSKAEKEIIEYVKSLGLDVETQFRLSKNNKYYFYDLKIGNKLIEYNGVYWHMNARLYNDTDINKNTGKTSKEIWAKDLDKKILALEKGYQLLVIEEDSWHKLKDRNKSMINHYLEINNSIDIMKSILEELNIIYTIEDNKFKFNNYSINVVEIFKNNYSKGCINIYEDQLKLLRNVIKDRINNLVSSERDYARKGYMVKEISTNQASEFLNKYHIQGYCPSSVKLGLIKDGELYSVMTFGKNRFCNDDSTELLRLASKKSIHGGAGKLFKYYTRNYKFTSIISYADKNWTLDRNNVYSKLGFDLVNENNNSFCYFDGIDRVNRMKFSNSTEWSANETAKYGCYIKVNIGGNFKYEYKNS